VYRTGLITKRWIDNRIQ